MRNRRLVLSILLAGIIATLFWSLSRVPALNEKAQMGLRTSVSSIAFDVIAPIGATDGLCHPRSQDHSKLALHQLEGYDVWTVVLRHGANRAGYGKETQFPTTVAEYTFRNVIRRTPRRMC